MVVCLTLTLASSCVVVVLTKLTKRKEDFYAQYSCGRSGKTYLNGVLGLPENLAPSPAQHYIEFQVSFRFHLVVKVINNLFQLTEIATVLSNLSSDLSH